MGLGEVLEAENLPSLLMEADVSAVSIEDRIEEIWWKSCCRRSVLGVLIRDTVKDEIKFLFKCDLR